MALQNAQNTSARTINPGRQPTTRMPRLATPPVGGSPEEALQHCAWLRSENLESYFPQFYANNDSSKVVSIDSFETYCAARRTFKKHLGNISTNDKTCLRMRFAHNEVAKMNLSKGDDISKVIPKLIAKAARLYP